MTLGEESGRKTFLKTSSDNNCDVAMIAESAVLLIAAKPAQICIQPKNFCAPPLS